jgi:tetratricopeptide (TPR) repeat protein
MEDELKSRLLDAQMAIELRNFARAKEILDGMNRATLPSNLRLDYLNFAGQAEIELQDFETGRAWMQEALDLAEFDPSLEPLRVERLRNWIGISYYRQHFYEKAQEQFRLCLDGARGDRITDRRFKLWAISNLANTQLILKDFTIALQTYKEALTLAKVGEDDETRAAIYWGIGSAYRDSKKLPEACRNFLRASGIYGRIGAAAQAATTKSLLGQALVDRGLYDKALEYLEQALKLTKPDDSYNLSLINLNEAYAYFELNRLAEARGRCEASIEFARKLQDAPMLGQALSQLGRILQAAGKDLEALASFKEAIVLLRGTDYKTALSVVYKRYIEITRKLNLIEEAIEAMEFAYNL